jgi:LysR family glycine cleavage system transcriptional activator
MFAVARAAQQGMGIALAPMPMSKVWFEQGLLNKLYDHEMLTNDRYYLVQHRKANDAPHLLAFAQWIKSRF